MVVALTRNMLTEKGRYDARDRKKSDKLTEMNRQIDK